MTTATVRDRTFTLAIGSHEPDSKACVMEAGAYLAGEPWSDHPACASPVITAFCIAAWDRFGPPIFAPMIERLEAITFSKVSPALDRRRTYLAADRAVRVFAADALEAAGLTEQARTLRALRPIRGKVTAAAAWAAAATATADSDAITLLDDMLALR